METKFITKEMDWVEGNVKNYFNKPLLSVDNGAIKLVKIGPDTAFPVHHHRDKTESVYILSGNPTLYIDSVEYNANPDEFYVFPLGIDHAIRNNTNSDCVLIVNAIKNKNELNENH